MAVGNLWPHPEGAFLGGLVLRLVFFIAQSTQSLRALRDFGSAAELRVRAGHGVMVAWCLDQLAPGLRRLDPRFVSRCGFVCEGEGFTLPATSMESDWVLEGHVPVKKKGL